MIELDDGEWESVKVGRQTVYISNEGGEIQIDVRDHMEMRIEGEHKGDVDITYSSGEFGASFEQVGGREFWERFYR
jgi:hypothetical protein